MKDLARLLAGSITVEIEDVNAPRWSFGDLGQLISILLQAALIVAGLATFAFLVLAGIQYITSGGEKAQMEAARGRITNAILGLAIVVGSYAIIRIIETVFGISIVSGIRWPGPGVTAPTPTPCPPGQICPI